jgi:FkbM family methyltransferase
MPTAKTPVTTDAMRTLDLKKMFPPETWLGDALRSTAARVPSRMVLPVLQGPNKGKRWIAGAGRPACWLGNYSPDESAVLSDTVKAGSVVFDLGAQAGYHSLHASTLVGESGKVYAFEPDRANVGYLKKHIAINGMSNIVVVDAAVSDFDGTSMFDSGVNCFSGHLSATGNTAVRTIRLDNEIAASRLPIPDYLKIDVEGEELKVLSGAREILAEAHPALLIETHEWMPEFSSISDDCWKFLTDLDYKLELVIECHIYAWHHSHQSHRH